MNLLRISLLWIIAAALGSMNFLPARPASAADSPAGQGPVAQGPVALWTFDELAPDGKTVADGSGNGHDGRFTGAPVLVDGKLGKALKLAGPPEQVNVGDLGTRAPATVAFWCNTRELFSDRRVFSQLTGPEDAHGALRFDGGQLEVFDGHQWLLVVKWGLRFDTWLHLAVVFDAEGNATGYLNGEPKQKVKAGFAFDGAEVGIGAKQLGRAGNPFIGRLDDFRVYRRALSAEEIRGLCPSTVPL